MASTGLGSRGRLLAQGGLRCGHAWYVGCQHQVIEEYVRHDQHHEKRHDGVREEVRSGGDPAERYQYAGRERGRERGAAAAQRHGQREGEECAGGIAGGERAVGIAFPAHDERRSEVLGPTELDDIPRTRAPEVVLESHVHDEAGTNYKNENYKERPPAIDVEEFALEDPVVDVQADDRGHGQPEEVHQRLLLQFLPPLAAQERTAVVEEPRNSEIDYGKGGDEDRKRQETDQDESATTQFQILHSATAPKACRAPLDVSPPRTPSLPTRILCAKTNKIGRTDSNRCNRLTLRDIVSRCLIPDSRWCPRCSSMPSATRSTSAGSQSGSRMRKAPTTPPSSPSWSPACACSLHFLRCWRIAGLSDHWPSC